MTENTKTPLQAAVSVICGCLVDLSFDDQICALEAVRENLGLPITQTVYQEPSSLPTVRVRMDGDRPTVVGASPPAERPRRGVIVVDPSPELYAQLNARRAPRQLPPSRPRGYIRPLR